MYCTVLNYTVLYCTTQHLSIMYSTELCVVVRAMIPVDRTMFLHISGMLEKDTKLEFLATSSEGRTVFKMKTASAVANLIKSVI